MAIYKCKMCGGDLDVAENATVAVCDYCGSKQTVPTSQDEELSSLFNRANILRRKCEFDKAEQLYEKILVKDDKQPEAYWGVLLCRYGIEYVEDPSTDKRIPTCHRTAFEAITSDEYYKSALLYADPVQKAIYEQEAKYIDGVQKDILALSQQEEPYDVFICYKETDNGKRTQDSVIANDIYYQLTSEGFKVFYAAITLENKLGSAYEPIIFAALNSAKVMLAIGTKSEYFNAVWVKNEWSRYLKMMKNDKSKQLIPCYRDMDAYELPEEFAHLQAQDMSKIGFISDIVRGIKKIVRKEEPKTESRSSEAGGATSLRNLMKRAYLDLESLNFDSARVQFDKMQDIDPENGEVYLIGLLCDFQTVRLEDLEECKVDFSTNPNFTKAIRFADPTLKTRLSQVKELNQKYRRYLATKKDLENIGDAGAYAEAEHRLKSLSGYRDSDALLADMPAQRNAYFSSKVESLISGLKGWVDYQEKATVISATIDEITDESIKAELTKKVEETARELKYQHAVTLFESNEVKIINVAEKLFTDLDEYKDSATLAEKCRDKIKSLGVAEAKNKKRAIIMASVAIAVVVLIHFIVILFTVILPSAKSNADTKLRGGVEYELSSDGSYYIVSGIEDTSLTDIVVLDSYKGKPVKEIATIYRKDGENLISITIPASVTSIDDSAFLYCGKLEKIIVNDGNSAYSSRDGILYDRGKTKIIEVPRAIKGTVTIPSSVTYLGGFAGCVNLTSITIPNGITSIEDYAFRSCTGLTSITIPNGVIAIGKQAFSGCGNLTNITIPNSITSIGEQAFSDYSNLTNITIPNSITSIGEQAFSGCSKLASITIPNGVTSIGKLAFEKCTSLTSAVWNAENCTKTADSYTGAIFSGCSNLRTIIFGENVKNIPDYALYGCKGLTSITIPQSVVSIGESAFGYCSELKDIYWNAENCTEAGSYSSSYLNNSNNTMIEGCNNLRSITFGENVKVIPDYLLSGCKLLTSITIPDGVTSIGNLAFEECSGLTTITIPKSVTAIGSSAFRNCSNLTNVTIENGLTTISRYAFYGCSSLESIILPNSITTIEDDAFCGCSSLTSITIPSSVTLIESNAFQNCSSLANAYFEDPVGWKYPSDYVGLLETIKNLDDSATAARFLASTYCRYKWTKE